MAFPWKQNHFLRKCATSWLREAFSPSSNNTRKRGDQTASGDVCPDNPPAYHPLMGNAPIRALIAKPGLDGHDRGAKVVVKALRDAGMEVIYTGRHQKVASIARAAADEDVDVVGLSVLSGAHEEYCRRVHEALIEAEHGDAVLVVGGTISEASRPVLEELGYLIYPTGSALTDIVSGIEKAVATRRANQS